MWDILYVKVGVTDGRLTGLARSQHGRTEAGFQDLWYSLKHTAKGQDHTLRHRFRSFYKH